MERAETGACQIQSGSQTVLIKHFGSKPVITAIEEARRGLVPIAEKIRER